VSTSPIELFSRSYPEARARFIEAASGHPHLTQRGSLPIDGAHTIDWAYTGAADAEDLLVYTCGLHGIEGYAGSAVMLRLLGLHEDTPALFLHALNPWGMAHFRRVNEGNVDLNRNFLSDGAPYVADDPAYAALEGLLNPKGPPRRETFLLQAAAQIARHGMGTLRNAVARGQYSFPQGIFYGGSKPEATTREVLSFLPVRVAHRRRVVHVDLHTARGPRGDYVAFLEGADPTAGARAKPIFGHRVRAWSATDADGYEMRGRMPPEPPRPRPAVRYDAITLEFGTASDLGILRALRAENQLHWHGERSAGPEHSARRAMRDAFFPDDPRWRASVVSYAVTIHRQAQRLLVSV